MRMDAHNAVTRALLVVLPVIALLALLGIGLWAAAGSAAVDPGTGTEIGNETVIVDNTTTGVTVFVDNESAITNETNATAYVYDAADPANGTAVANATETLNATDTSTAVSVAIENATVDLNSTVDWSVVVVGDGDASAVSIVSVDTETMSGGGGGGIGGAEAGGMAAGVAVLAIVAFAIGRKR